MNILYRVIRWMARNWRGECTKCGRKLDFCASGGWCPKHGAM